MRRLHRVLAFILRQFWTRCPHCHAQFGGHQKHRMGHAKVGGKHYRYLCSGCAQEVEAK